MLTKDESYRGWFFEWIKEWSQFFGPCNWYTFHPLMLEIEDDSHMGGIEATLIVLGLGFRVRWNHTETDVIRGIQAQVAALDKENGQ